MRIHPVTPLLPPKAPAMKTFDFAPGISLRVIEKDGEPWFVAKDVCDALGLSDTHMALATVDSENKHQHSLGLRGRAPWIISEPGFYMLIGKSRRPEAKQFQRWVTHEVLPTIRKTGGYMVPSVAVKVAENPTGKPSGALSASP